MKYFFKRILPNAEKIGKMKVLRPLLKYIGRAQIWQVNRATIAGGVACGLFFGSLPIPGQVPCACVAAIIGRVNLPIAAIITFFSNPFTYAPIFYFNYCIGVWLFGGGVHEGVHFNVAHLTRLGGEILMPLFSGSIVVGLVLACLGYMVVKLSWRVSIMRSKQQRNRRC